MPRKIKILWVLCCVFIFIGFIYLSMLEQREEAEKRREERTVQVQKRQQEKKARIEQASEIRKTIDQTRELVALGKFQEAVTLAEETAEKNPKNAEVVTWWGVALARQGKHTEALDKFIQSSSLDPNQAKTYIYWGLTLDMLGRPEEAIDKYENALLLKPDDSNAYAYWGAALAKLKQYDEAAKKLEEALEYNPKNSLVFGVLVDSYFHKGEYKNAWSTVARARKANVTLPEASLKRLSDASPEPR